MEITKRYLLALLAAKDIEKTVNSNLDYRMWYILEYIGMNSSSSVYDCQNYLNNIRIKISYENVDVQIQNLFHLGLVEEDTNVIKKNKNSIEEDESKEKSKNNPKSYSISSAGIFYLVRKNPTNIVIELISNNKEDGLFINFLYPYLDFKTLEKIEHLRAIMHITRFLSRCCETIQTELKTLRNIEEKGGETHTLGYIEGLANPEYDDGFYGPRGFLQGLKMSLKLNWIDIDNTKITEIEKNKRFKIHDEKNHELYLEIYPKRNIAVFSNNSHKIKEFTLEKDPSGNYAITYFHPVMIEDYIDQRFENPHFYFYYEIEAYEKEFCNSMLEYIHNEYNIMSEEQRRIKRQDCIAIAKDEKFQVIANHYKQIVDSHFDSFRMLSKIQQV